MTLKELLSQLLDQAIAEEPSERQRTRLLQIKGYIQANLVAWGAV